MTDTAATPADIAAPGNAWRSLFWVVPPALLWIALIAWQPIIPVSGVQTTAHQLMAHGIIALGLWLGLQKSDLRPARRRATWLAVMVPYTLWFALAWSAAIDGAFHAGASSFPLLP